MCFQICTVCCRPHADTSALHHTASLLTATITVTDRLSTRPLLNLEEKRWIVFQMLKAVAGCHTSNVCHGDIKLDNVLLTSWNWVFLTDFASFKPTRIPVDNPAAFSFFFDTSGRQGLSSGSFMPQTTMSHLTWRCPFQRVTLRPRGFTCQTALKEQTPTFVDSTVSFFRQWTSSPSAV